MGFILCSVLSHMVLCTREEYSGEDQKLQALTGKSPPVFSHSLWILEENSAEDTLLAFVGPELLKSTLPSPSFCNQIVQRKHRTGSGPSRYSDT